MSSTIRMITTYTSIPIRPEFIIGDVEKHVTNHMSPPHLHLLMARQDNTNN